MGDRGSGAFVGRGAELSALVGALEDAVAGRGRLCLVAGEPGIGKSRLVEELAGVARDRSLRVLWGRCWEAGGAPAYWPWVQCLRAALRAADPEVLRGTVGAGASHLAQMLPEIRDAFPELPEPPALDPELARFRLFEATTELLRAVSARAPQVLILEDVHAADTPSLLLLEFLARELDDARLLVLATYRDIEVRRDHPLSRTLAELRRATATQVLTLSGLSEDDVGRFIELSAGVVPSHRMLGALHRETEGNPLFVGEMVRLLASEGRLQEGDAAAIKPVPQGIRDVIGRRIGHLSERCNHVLSVASVLGRDFALDVLERLSERSADELLDILDEAIVARVAVETPSSLGSMRFSHSLIRDTLYEELSPARRLRLHRRAGEILETLFGKNPERLAELAHHFFAAAPAGDAAKAVQYARAAGEHAALSLAYEEASRLYRMALQALSLAEDRDEAARGELLLRIGDVEGRAGDQAEAKRWFLEAADVARSIGSAEQLARAALGYGGRFVWTKSAGYPGLITLLEDALRAVGELPSPMRARLLARLSGALRDRPEREPRESLARESVEIAAQTGDGRTLAWALSARFASIWYPDTPRERLAIADELVEVAERTGEPESLHDGHLWRWVTLLELGDTDACKREADELARLSGAIRQGSHWWLDVGLRATTALFEGRYAEADRMIEDALAVGSRAQTWDATVAYCMHRLLLARERDEAVAVEPLVRETITRFPEYPMFRCALAGILAGRGATEEADALLRTLAADDFAALPWDNEWLFGMAELAEAAVRLRNRDIAARLYERMLPFEGSNVLGPGEGILGSAARHLGILAALLGRTEEAERHLERAMQENMRMGARPWVAHTQHVLARMLLERGGPSDAQRARELLDTALATARALGMIALERAIAGGPEPSEAPAGAAMFRREGEYYTIAWEGRSFRLRDAKGLRYLSMLLGSPGREHHSLELVAAVEGNVGESLPAEARPPVSGGGPDDVLDAGAREAYKRRLRDLEQEIEEARSFGDGERAASLEEERQFLVSELAAAMGLGGRSRKVASDAERARVNVTRAIRSALGRIAEHSRALGDHLEATVSTGTFCSYTPDPRAPLTWQL